MKKIDHLFNMQRASLNMNNDLKFNIVWLIDNSLKNIN